MRMLLTLLLLLPVLASGRMLQLFCWDGLEQHGTIVADHEGMAHFMDAVQTMPGKDRSVLGLSEVFSASGTGSSSQLNVLVFVSFVTSTAVGSIQKVLEETGTGASVSATTLIDAGSDTLSFCESGPQDPTHLSFNGCVSAVSPITDMTGWTTANVHGLLWFDNVDNVGHTFDLYSYTEADLVASYTPANGNPGSFTCTLPATSLQSGQVFMVSCVAAGGATVPYNGAGILINSGTEELPFPSDQFLPAINIDYGPGPAVYQETASAGPVYRQRTDEATSLRTAPVYNIVPVPDHPSDHFDAFARSVVDDLKRQLFYVVIVFGVVFFTIAALIICCCAKARNKTKQTKKKKKTKARKVVVVG